MATPEQPDSPESTRWKRIEQLFEGALEQPAGTRCAWLAEACGDDQELFQEVSSLIEADQKAYGFVDSAVRNVAGDLNRELEPGPGMRVGQYRIVHEIGRGSTGGVYVAEHADNSGEARVAIRILNPLLNQDAVAARIQRERQILAGLDHPYIVKVLDSGTLPDGRLWVAMDYVPGLTITAYCDSMRLGMRDRVRLLSLVCAAVQFAHQHLVVHGGLKPGSILIAPDGSPKVLDFGLARLHEPESGAPVTTAIDIHALGAILYELLTGKPPQRVRSANPAADIERPSRIAALNQRRIPWLQVADLDSLAMKALSRKPGVSYPSAGQFEEDLRRFLSGAPVVARGSSLWYSAARHANRFRLPVAVAMLGVAGLIVAVLLFYREKQSAERRFAQVQNLSSELLFRIYDSIHDIPGSTEARGMVVRTALTHLDTLASEAGRDPVLEQQLMVAYERIGDVLTETVTPNSGRSGDALDSYTKALRLAEVLWTQTKSPGLAERMLRIQHHIGQIVSDRGMQDKAREHYLTTAAFAEHLPPEIRDAPGVQNQVVLLYQDTSRLQSGGEALATAQKAAAIAETLAARVPDNVQYQNTLGDAVHAVALNLRRQSRAREAMPYYLRLLEVRQKVSARQPQSVAASRSLMIAWGSLGDLQFTENRDGTGPSALECFKQAAAIAERLALADPANLFAATDKGMALSRVGSAWPASDPEGAIEVFLRARQAFEKALAGNVRVYPAKSNLIYMDELLADRYVRAGRKAEARDLYRRTIRLGEEFVDQYPRDLSSHQGLLLSYTALGKLMLQEGDKAGALAMARRGAESADVYDDGLRRPCILRARVYAAAAEITAKAAPANHSVAEWYAKALSQWKAAEAAGPLTADESAEMARAKSFSDSQR